MIVVGTGGHAIDMLSDFQSDVKKMIFLDTINHFPNGKTLDGFQVFNSIDKALKMHPEESHFLLALGNPINRKKMYLLLENAGLIPETYVSRHAMISPSSVIATGANIMPFASIFGQTKLGRGVLINSYASIHHNATVGDFCEISPGARILGHVNIEENAQIGTNAVVMPKLRVGNGSIVGAGAVVTDDIPANCIAVGVPAKVVSSLNVPI